MKNITSCKACGSTDLSWDTSNRTNKDIQQGRLNTADVTCVFVLGCNGCSETLAVVNASKIAASMNADNSADGELVKDATRDVMHIAAYLKETKAPETVANRLQAVEDFVASAPIPKEAATLVNAFPDSRFLHSNAVAIDEPQVDRTRLYFWRCGWNAYRTALAAVLLMPGPAIEGDTTACAACENGDFNSEVLGRVITYLSQFPEFQPEGDDSADRAFKNIVECIDRLRLAAPANPSSINEAALLRSNKQPWGDLYGTGIKYGRSAVRQLQRR